ncbi:putative nuclease HARBI1 [Hyposmocoma kahamanoa]|uniref:putative nuclease HARBI1 n=1 Tax=Hyposmocoma kahamanoa TaxID=1477025 RepID=UPI000E6DA269|nr:putative nuclease HARBI1 [Hyposmocoma kahamanoa]XP_026328186.1 putative nuclease HARBI1 [Hyposmocoma kahamanoa]
MSSSDSLSDLEGLSDWSTSDSDEESNRRSYKVRVDHFNTLDFYEFQVRFRLDKTSVQQLLDEIYPYLTVKSTRNHGIKPLHQLLLTLRFYALGTMLLSVADFAGVSKASACRIVYDVSCAIAQLYNKYIYMQTNTEQDFYEIARFPRVLGALDGTHIRIQSPCSHTGEEFRNRKGYFSLNVQAVCNAKLLFMNVVARWPGSAHDATIFNNSELRAQCESGLYGTKWLLADSAYPLKPYLLTPLLNPQSRGEQLYNVAHIRTRNCIERCFGVWKRRFPVIGLTMRLSLNRIHAVIIATAVLHNICRLHKLDDIPPEVEVPNEEVPILNSIEEPNNTCTERATLIMDFFNNLSSHGQPFSTG